MTALLQAEGLQCEQSPPGPDGGIDINEEGWARVAGGAPGAGLDDPEAALADPETWVKLGKIIYAAASCEDVAEMTGQTF